MSSRREARAQRKQLKQAKADASNLKLIRSVISEGPVAGYDVQIESSPKVAPHLQRELDKEQEPRVEASGADTRLVTWCITQKDCEGSWSWGEARSWTQAEWDEAILPKLNDFATKTWAEVRQSSANNGRVMHHDQAVSTLVKDARDRWKELNLEQFDVAFRFRLAGAKRAWGYIAQMHFFMVWWERKHKIYPLDN